MTAASSLRLIVDRRTEVSAGVVAFDLKHALGSPLPTWTPGAHIDVTVDGAPTRQYSLCGDPDDRTGWRIAVLREPDGRGGSAALHDRVVPGSEVEVVGPRNHFGLEPSPSYLFLAGGIGITPILAMVARAESAGADWRLVYGGRSRAAMAFADTLVARYGNRVEIVPQDEAGLIDVGREIGGLRPHTLVYCCGPEPLLVAVEAALGTDVDRLRLERFAPTAPTPATPEVAFDVELARTGVVVRVPVGRSILDVAEEAGAPVLYSCREGVCGTCETQVLDGRPEHRDSVLSPEEHDADATVMICVSRARSQRLVLDL